MLIYVRCPECNNAVAVAVKSPTPENFDWWLGSWSGAVDAPAFCVKSEGGCGLAFRYKLTLAWKAYRDPLLTEGGE